MKRIGCCLAIAVLFAGRTWAATPEQIAFFENNVRPLLVTHCIECHGEQKQKGGLRLDRRSAWVKGGDSGPAIVPNKPDDSLLVKAVRYQDKDLRMPPKKALRPQEMEILAEWVRQGAYDPRTDDGGTVVSTKDADWEAIFQKRLDWWSLKPLRAAEPPTPFAGPWGRDAIDRLIKAKLDAEQLTPAPVAEPEVLLRRLCFVLTGLPPTPTQRAEFLRRVQQQPTEAYHQLVDELLASPHVGERFARHWMDVVRYTDTYGYEWDNPAKGSHEYRDYLIRAFNSDVPFDQLVREQLAGDLLPQPRINTALGINESIIGPMFYHMGEHRHGSSLVFNGVHQEMVNNKIEAFSKAFLATTVACARCHDHKLEAVSQRDYYALGAVFMTPRWTARVADSPDKNKVAIAQLQELRTQLRQQISARWRQTARTPNAWSIRLTQVLAAQQAKPPTIDDVLYPLSRLNVPPVEQVARWNELAAEWQKAHAARKQHNQAFTTLADFTKPTLPAGWVSEGDGMTYGYVVDGTPLIALTGDDVFAQLLPQGYHTHALSSKLPGALRMPPDHVVPKARVSLKLAGGEFGGYLEMHENAFQGEEVTFLKNSTPQWRTFADKAHVHGITRITYDFATAALNPNFPPRTGLAAGLPNNDFGYDKRSWISITGIVAHDQASTPLDTLDVFAGLFAGEAPTTSAQVQERLAAWFTHAVERWCDDKLQAGDQTLLAWLLANRFLPNQPDAKTADLLREYRRIETSIAFPRTVNSMDERASAKAHYAFNVRGNVDVINGMIAPDFLRMFAGRHNVADSAGSGRLELANALLQPDHPLTARVYVNRVWQWLMGTGLVATPDDFGRLGEKPTHPELLDYLATEFIRNGWSTKKLIRRLVHTETFRQAGLVTDEHQRADPANRWRHHYPTRRLEAEALRDSMLAVSGRLDRTLYGRPILPPRVAEDGAKRLYAGPLDGHGRRSLYLQMSIMEPPKFLVGFNLPDLRLPTGKRDTTNVPAQALLLLNDPFVHAMARHWGEQLVKAKHASVDERLQAMFVAALAREATPDERQRWGKAASELATSAKVLDDLTVWTALAHTMLNTKEFLYYR